MDFFKVCHREVSMKSGLEDRNNDLIVRPYVWDIKSQ